jgi:hypothetical protein
LVGAYAIHGNRSNCSNKLIAGVGEREAVAVKDGVSVGKGVSLGEGVFVDTTAVARLVPDGGFEPEVGAGAVTGWFAQPTRKIATINWTIFLLIFLTSMKIAFW